MAPGRYISHRTTKAPPIRSAGMRPPGSVLWYLVGNPAKRALQLMQIGLSHISGGGVKRMEAKKSLDSMSITKLPYYRVGN